MAKNEKEGEVKVRLLSKKEVKEYLELFLDQYKCFVEGKNVDELITKEDKQKISIFFSYMGYLFHNGIDLGGLSKEKQKEIVGRVKDFSAVYFGLFSRKESLQYLYGALEEKLKGGKYDLEYVCHVLPVMVLVPHVLVFVLLPEVSICNKKVSLANKLMSQCMERELSLEELSSILKQCKDTFPVSYNRSIRTALRFLV